ncbi:type I restriction endonuclease [Psychromicrobium sp. YIM B11713]|uniref:type I restriction endonuclease n=1 Tax=Psychromicrobium sp. YIM B11713 TaxID=3145233 RepID=UPI00374EE269
MEFNERLRALGTKIGNQAEAIATEEATKNAFVMPFISSILGYDVFDPLEVVPEFTADVGTKRGEKIDYAVMREGEVQILIECKTSKSALTLENASQLYRYFGVTNARIAALTNGIIWQFYTDLDAPNRMDSKPFLVLDLSDIDEILIPEIQKLSKDDFNLESIISTAEELKYVGALKREIAAQFREPSDEFVRFIATRVYDGLFTQRVREQFSVLVTKAAKQFLTDQVNDRLKTALGAGTQVPSAESPSDASVDSGSVAERDLDRDTEIETTLEELEGYQIVKAIACADVKPQRITHRDSKSYFAILLDDNNRKPIARLHFNSARQKYLGLLDEDKNETRHPLNSLEEIYTFVEEIREAVRRYQ